MVINNQTAAENAALGSNAKFGPGQGNPAQVEKDSRRRRFRLQARARRLLSGVTRKDRKGDAAPYRVENCLLVPGYQSSGATVARLSVPGVDGVAAAATYRHLQVCASVWHCPLCAARIANERREELRRAVLLAEQKGYKAVLVTYTARHDAATDLKSQLQAMTEAHRMVWRGGAADRLRGQYGILGMVRSLECTHSKLNGWHPHIHAIIFVKADTDVQVFGAALRARWEHCAAHHGLTMNEHGFDIMDSTARIAAYIAKWGHEPRWREADELARWHTKKGRGVREYKGHYSPWQLLDFADSGDAEAGVLWIEYAQVYHGRKQLHWSAGLRAALGLGEEISDEEAAQKEMEEATDDYEISLNDEQWAKVRRWLEIDVETGEVILPKRYRDRRCELLELVEHCTADEIVDRCRREYGFEPVLHIPWRGQAPEPELSEEEQEQLRVSQLLDQVRRESGQIVDTPDGLGRVQSVVLCPILHRWRVSVYLEQPDQAGVIWRAFDLAQISVIEQSRLFVA